MRTLLSWALLALLLTGCSAPLPTARLNRPAQRPVAQAVPDPEVASPQAEMAAKAALWADRLVEPNETTRRQACQALNDLGPVGYPHLIKAIKGDVHELSLLALGTLSQPALQEHSKEMVPLLLEKLQDSDPTMRRLAAERLAWFDRQLGTEGEIYPGPQAQDRLKALQKAAQSDKDSAVRSLAATSAGQVQQAINGRVAQLDARTLGGNPVVAPPTSNVRPKREIPPR
jgi:hypothetical protein